MRWAARLRLALRSWFRASAVADDVDAELRAACAAMLADYQTSEHHHPRHVLVSLAAFEAMRAALRLAEGTEAATPSQLGPGTNQKDPL